MRGIPSDVISKYCFLRCEVLGNCGTYNTIVSNVWGEGASQLHGPSLSDAIERSIALEVPI